VAAEKPGKMRSKWPLPAKLWVLSDPNPQIQVLSSYPRNRKFQGETGSRAGSLNGICTSALLYHSLWSVLLTVGWSSQAELRTSFSNLAERVAPQVVSPLLPAKKPFSK
jgi:hypothetical protein